MNPLAQTRNKRVYSVAMYENSNVVESHSLYNRFKAIDEKSKKKIFKTKLLRTKEYCLCDICGERLKIGTLSLYSSYFNMKGHSEHVMDYINNFYKYPSKI